MKQEKIQDLKKLAFGLTLFAAGTGLGSVSTNAYRDVKEAQYYDAQNEYLLDSKDGKFDRLYEFKKYIRESTETAFRYDSTIRTLDVPINSEKEKYVYVKTIILNKSVNNLDINDNGKVKAK